MAARRNLTLAGALVALVAIVALASRAHTPAGGGATHGVDSKLIWEFVLIGVVGLFVLCIPVAAWVVLSTRGDRPLSHTRRRKSFQRVLVGMVIFFVAFAFAVGRFHPGSHKKATKSPVPTNLATGPQKPNKLGKKVPFDWLPAIVVLSTAPLGAGVLGYVLFLVAFLGGFYALATGRYPKGFRDLSAYCLRFQAQTYGYLFLLTDKYPTLANL